MLKIQDTQAPLIDTSKSYLVEVQCPLSCQVDSGGVQSLSGLLARGTPSNYRHVAVINLIVSSQLTLCTYGNVKYITIVISNFFNFFVQSTDVLHN